MKANTKAHTIAKRALSSLKAMQAGRYYSSVPWTMCLFSALEIIVYQGEN